MSMKSWKAAVALQKLRNHRSCVSRFYYAAFSAVTAEVRKVAHHFPNGFEHPPHPQMGKAIKRHLVQFDRPERNELRDAMSRLYNARLDADYRHQADPGDADARNAMRDARYVMESLGQL